MYDRLIMERYWRTTAMWAEGNWSYSAVKDDGVHGMGVTSRIARPLCAKSDPDPAHSQIAARIICLEFIEPAPFWHPRRTLSGPGRMNSEPAAICVKLRLSYRRVSSSHLAGVDRASMPPLNRVELFNDQTMRERGVWI